MIEETAGQNIMSASTQGGYKYNEVLSHTTCGQHAIIS